MTKRELLILIVCLFGFLLYFFKSNQDSERYQQERDSLAVLYHFTLDSVILLNDSLNALDTLIRADTIRINIVREKIKYIPLKYEKKYRIGRELSVDSLEQRLRARLDSAIRRTRDRSGFLADSIG